MINFIGLAVHFPRIMNVFVRSIVFTVPLCTKNPGSFRWPKPLQALISRFSLLVGLKAGDFAPYKLLTVLNRFEYWSHIAVLGRIFPRRVLGIFIRVHRIAFSCLLKAVSDLQWSRFLSWAWRSEPLYCVSPLKNYN